MLLTRLEDCAVAAAVDASHVQPELDRVDQVGRAVEQRGRVDEVPRDAQRLSLRFEKRPAVLQIRQRTLVLLVQVEDNPASDERRRE